MPEATPGLVRCPRCGAGNPADAEWCGQCLTRFDAGPVEPSEEVSMPEIAKAGGEPTWICPACDTQNPIEAEACRRCGSAFTSFLSEGRAPAAPKVSGPGPLVALTAVLPGLGHWSMGRRGLGAARALLYLWTLGLSLLLLIRPPSNGGAVVRLVGVVFLLAAAGVWVVAMMETMRLVEGDERPVIPPKALTWVAAGLSVILFMGLLGAALAGRGTP